jgi:hypothetical protein
MIALHRSLIALVIPLLGVACASTTVKKDPGQHDRGIRYYRPKPYLLLTPTSGAGDDQVSISLQYLPDYSEEYSIHIRAGIGKNKTVVKLENGWNLTSVDADIDSQTDENLTAMAKMVEAVGGIIPSSGKGALPATQVKATNVPLGYYESVISLGPDGRKRMYGWKYLGFLPYTQCPVGMSGAVCADCQSETLYGLVFENGVMTFKPMVGTAIANNIRDPKIPSLLPAAIIKAIDEIRKTAPTTIKLGTVLTSENVMVELGGTEGKTFLVTVTLPEDPYKAVLKGIIDPAVNPSPTPEQQLDAVKKKIESDMAAVVLKSMKMDPTWTVSGSLVKKN